MPESRRGLALRNLGSRDRERRHEHRTQTSDHVLDMRPRTRILTKVQRPSSARARIADWRARYCLQQGVVGGKTSPRLVVCLRIRNVVDQGAPGCKSFLGWSPKEPCGDSIDHIELGLHVDAEAQAVTAGIVQQSLSELADVGSGHAPTVARPAPGRDIGATCQRAAQAPELQVFQRNSIDRTPSGHLPSDLRAEWPKRPIDRSPRTCNQSLRPLRSRPCRSQPT